MATAQKGFAVRCLSCGDEQTRPSVYLDDVQTVRCPTCDTGFTVDEIRGVLASWQRVLEWLEAAPTVGDWATGVD